MVQYGLQGGGSRQARYHYVVCGTAMTSSRCCSHQLPHHKKRPTTRVGREAGYSPKAKIFRVALHKRACDGCRSNANQRTCSQVPVPDRKRSAAIKKHRHKVGVFLLVGEAGFGPAKSVTTDLQSAPFGRSGIPP